MIDFQEASQLAIRFLNSSDWNETNDVFVIIPEMTIEKDYGWIFFYNAQNYLVTGDPSLGLKGNMPIVLLKTNGAIDVLGPGIDMNKIIENYETNLSKMNN